MTMPLKSQKLIFTLAALSFLIAVGLIVSRQSDNSNLTPEPATVRGSTTPQIFSSEEEDEDWQNAEAEEEHSQTPDHASSLYAEIESILNKPLTEQSAEQLKQLYSQLTLEGFYHVSNLIGGEEGFSMRTSSELLAPLLEAWIQTAPEEAMSQAIGLGGNLGASYAGPAFKLWLDKNPQQAEAFLIRHMQQDHNEEEASARLFEAYTSKLLEVQSWPQIQLAIDTTQSPAFQEATLLALSQQLADSNISKSELANWALQLAQENHFSADEALTQLTQKWANQNPEEAIAWTLQTEDHTLQTTLMNNIFEYWAINDPLSAGEYINSIENSPHLDTILHHYTTTTMSISPTTAIEWAASIDSYDLRNETVAIVWMEWYRQDRDQANKWMNDASLEPAQLSNLQERAKIIDSDPFE